MYSAIALMVFSLASPVTHASSVRGSVEVVQDGYSLDCVGVRLIPRSLETDAAVKQQFGTLDKGVRITFTSIVPQVSYDPPQGSRMSRCRGRFSEKFKFSDVPAGEYFLTTTAVPKRRYEDEKSRLKTIEMMQRVSVEPASSLTADFKHND
jgi:hypothetical protein